MIDQEVIDYLRGMDISILSLNDILSKLLDRFGKDFSNEKETIEEILVELNIASDRSENDVDDYELARRLQKQECRHSGRRTKKKGRNAVVKKSSSSSATAKNAFSRPLLVSKCLQDITNTEMCSRPDVVKAIWKYIKEHDLQDPNDKRFILCDDLLTKIFRKKRISCFGMNRELSKHLMPTDESTVKVEEDHDSHHREILVHIPEKWKSAGFSHEMAYHQVQMEILKLLKDHRLDNDPDVITRSSNNAVILDLMPPGCEVCSTWDIFKNLRLKFKDQIENS